MSNLRFKALEFVQSRQPVTVTPPAGRVSEFYGTNTFGIENMKATLPKETLKKLMACIEKGEKIDSSVADIIASAMKAWAISKGVTHYTHWFQPLTGTTAEKHDAFFEPTADGRAMEAFKGSALIQQEPDASSFPNGGIRSTFEARGYTGWDPTSPAFIMDLGYGKTLCIPTIFVSYTGEALDYKAPLLKSIDALDKAATAVMQEYFDTDVTKVYCNLGPEQEYFLVDKALYLARPDLVMCGRTLFGQVSSRNQQLEDHYFGSIPPRVLAFMADSEFELLKLGIPVKTRHNEVAPSQFEVAPLFEEINLAVDHNALMMDVMEKVADKHHLKVLFHEKPFAGVNGSGKHNNWSMATNNGRNLLGPSSKPKDNFIFLTFCVNVVKAVHDNADLMRAAIATVGNEHRLGANEAPPAIFSVFLGTTLTSVFDELEANGKVKVDKGENMYMKLGISKIPQLILDNTDRNRTSPFAFTGNKFEFRAVGSSANNGHGMTVLNTIVADQLIKFQADVEKELKKEPKKEIAIVNVLREYVKASKKIRFEGNGYSDEWVKEAEKRGLKNIKTAPEALDAFLDKKAVKMFVDHSVFNETEIHARHEIMLEVYTKRIQIESRSMYDLAMNQIIPAALAYQSTLITNVKGQKEIGIDAKYSKSTTDIIKSISEHVAMVIDESEAMLEARKKANDIEDGKKKAMAYCHDIKGKYFDKIRYHVDKLEHYVGDEFWPLPKYREMLFVK
ncbi:MAG: glutamine synthetase type III [Bacteroidetes bacterium]|nr:MAG: glutamine synthetase type III [Bacteroidota bacterium]